MEGEESPRSAVDLPTSSLVVRQPTARLVIIGNEVLSGKVEDAKLALVIFSALDTNDDEMLHLPEFLYTWGRWARARKETKDRR